MAKGQIRSRKPNNFIGTSMRLLRYMSSRALWIIVAFAFAILSAILLARAPEMLGRVTTEIFEGLQARTAAGGDASGQFIDFEVIKEIIGTVLIMYVVGGAASYVLQFIMVHLVQNTVYDLRRDLKKKMSRLPIKYYDTHSNGDIMSRAVNDMDQIANTLQRTLTQIMMSSVQLVTVLIVMLSVSVRLALVTILTVPISAMLIALVAPKAQRQFSAQQKELGQLNDLIEETYSGQEIIKVYNLSLIHI